MPPRITPCSARAGTSSSRRISDWVAYRSTTRSRISSSAARGVRPSADRVGTPAPAWRSRPATRTMKNSSRLDDTIEQNRTRSSSGTVGSAAWASTRRSKSRRDSSRFRNRLSGACSTAAVPTSSRLIRPS